ncbi:type II secretion system protein [Amnibacterium kyonggiense]|uniref:Prepilin-type N-terminal cleavage/methylation domain-containing protein n=1 Tax=Amnibacterium kyonggiense TaxID=595671 RepID=A0A4R7FQR7_9MICO|nr:prepilin-type N-terminal cleavage/methylation domain-containing protein [Amnibacterium kyonggiense]TDS80103.1 prepilin-type N-terminal cleavage/methylation domain-containing protein [Amnibacterium kyonggiense]
MGDARHRRDRFDAGFTLIELVVVIMIIGILVGVSAPSYVGLVKGVRESATQADLGSDRSALVAYGIDSNGVFPQKSNLDTSTGSLLAGYGWQKSMETQQLDYFPSVTRTSWCLQGTSVTGTVFRVSPRNPTLAGTCSALGESNY